jgi:hypothetical protein
VDEDKLPLRERDGEYDFYNLIAFISMWFGSYAGKYKSE